MTPDASRQDTLYRKLIENMNEGVWMGDAKERTVYANPKFCQMMGYSLQEMMGRESYDFWDEPSKRRVRKVNRSDRKKGVSSSYEGTLLTKTGSLIPVLLSGTPLPDGGTIGIMTDLIEVKRKQETAMLLEHALQASTEGIVLISKDCTISSWNAGAQTIFGYTAEKIMGKPLTTLFPGWNAEQHLPKGKGAYDFELQAQQQRGGAITVAVSVGTLPANEQKLGYLILARDVSAQRRFEEELALKYQKMCDAYNQFGIIRRQMDYLFELTELAAAQHDAKTLADYVVSAVVMLSHVDGCLLQICDEGGMLHTLSSFGMGKGWDLQKSTPFKGSAAERSVKEKRPVKILDIARERGDAGRGLLLERGFSSALVIALSFQGKVIGSISLYVTPEKKLELFENGFVEKYAELIAIILAKRAG